MLRLVDRHAEEMVASDSVRCPSLFEQETRHHNGFASCLEGKSTR